jgi:hypothetical protein
VDGCLGVGGEDETNESTRFSLGGWDGSVQSHEAPRIIGFSS